MIRATQRALLSATIALLLADVHPASAQTAVTSCEQVLQGDGYLSGDLNCGPNTEAAVEIRPGGTLDMRGFAIHGGEYGVLCSGPAQTIGSLEVFPYAPCRVFGGGTIDGQSVVGIVASRLDLADVTINSDAIALIIHRRLSFTNVNLQLGGQYSVGIEAAATAPIVGTGLTITGGGTGITFGGRVKIDGLTASGYGRTFALTPRSISLANASLTGGEHAIHDYNDRPCISRCLHTLRVTLTDSVVTGHSDTAVKATRIRLTRSIVTGNGLDLQAEYRPALRDSSCQTSNGWGVCTND